MSNADNLDGEICRWPWYCPIQLEAATYPRKKHGKSPCVVMVSSSHFEDSIRCCWDPKDGLVCLLFFLVCLTSI
ncbi:hypothetical protein BDW60DRAFT_190341 [Aspergillus nidulans var. acristatus]